MAEVRLYDYLFTKENPTDVPEGADWKDSLNPNSLQRLISCRVEPGLKNATPGSRFQFERKGYFVVDPDSSDDKLLFNQIVSLRDEWVRIQKAQQSERTGKKK